MTNNNIISIASATPSLPVRPRSRRGRNTIAARVITLASRGKREQAYWAADWVRGGLAITPTLALAARVFGVSVAAVRAALTDLEASTELEPAIDTLWARMTWSERDKFFTNHYDALRSCDDRITTLKAQA
jgi:hypothetical protein